MPRSPLNILQSCFSHSWGGLEIQALEVSRQLIKRGHRVWLACPRDSRMQEEAERRHIRVLPLRVTGYFHPVTAARLARFLRQQEIDIIHAQHSRDIATLVPAMKFSFLKIPLLLSKRVGSYIQKKDLFHRFTYRNVSRVLAISSVIHRNVLDTTPMTAEGVVTLHDAIDTELFSPERANGSKIRAELGIGKETVVIGFVGRFSAGKGHEELLKAIDIVRKLQKNLRFLVVGEASYGEEEYEGKIRDLATSLRVDDIVTFMGFRSDIPDVMAAFDIFAFPSHAESFGVVLIEAMAMERPVVSTNCDGVLDIVVDGETGLYVHPRNPDELAASLLRLIKDPVLRQRFGTAGRRRVVELFDQRRQLDRLEELYYSLLQARQKGS